MEQTFVSVYGGPWKGKAYNSRLYNRELSCQEEGRGIHTTPDWAQQVTALRKELEESQVEFSKRFNVSQTTVSYWESGRKEPSVKNYVRMGNIALPPGCYWFWKRAGVDIGRLRDLIVEELRSDKK